MVDLRDAAQAGIFAALNVPAVNSLAPVHQHVSEDTEPPLTIIGEISSTNAGGKDGGLELIQVRVLTVIRQPGREYLTPAMAAARVQIEGATLTAAGAVLSRPVFESADDELLDDGQTYVGQQRFSLFAQPAD